MVATTTLDVSKWQDPDNPGGVAWEDWIKRGVTSVIVQLSHGTSYEPKAKEFIANARSHNLKVHGYHFYEGSLDEILFSYQNAENLGLDKGAYMFLDMEGSIGGNWQDQFYSFRSTWLQAGFHAGLYVSDSPYIQRFDNNKLVSDNVYRWITNYTKEPKNYDIWQYSDSNGKQDVSYDRTGKLGQDYVPHQVPSLVPQDHPESNFEPAPRNPDKPSGSAWVGWGNDSSGLGGGKTLGYSTDGKNFYAVISPFGLVFRQNDFNRIWANIKLRLPKVADQIKWASIIDKPDFALKTDLPDLNEYAKKTEIPTLTGMATEEELTKYAKKSDIPNVNGLAKETELADYAKKSDIPSLPDLSKYALKTDLPDVSGFAKQTDLSNVKTTAESALSNAEKAQSTADVNAKLLADKVDKSELEQAIQSVNDKKIPTITSGMLADLTDKPGTSTYEIDCIPSDSPVSDWGLCDVTVSDHYARQVFTNIGDGSGDTYVRFRKNDNAWSSWREVTLWN